MARPATARSNVVLPQPEGPTSTHIAPRSIESEMSLNTGVGPKLLPSFSSTDETHAAPPRDRTTARRMLVAAQTMRKYAAISTLSRWPLPELSTFIRICSVG